jgi:hypothetical protein
MHRREHFVVMNIRRITSNSRTRINTRTNKSSSTFTNQRKKDDQLTLGSSKSRCNDIQTNKNCIHRHFDDTDEDEDDDRNNRAETRLTEAFHFVVVEDRGDTKSKKAREEKEEEEEEERDDRLNCSSRRIEMELKNKVKENSLGMSKSTRTNEVSSFNQVINLRLCNTDRQRERETKGIEQHEQTDY